MARNCHLRFVVCLVVSLAVTFELNFYHFFAASTGSGKRLTKSSQCPGKVVSRASWYRTLRARSVLECVTLCMPEGKCVSVVYMSGNDTCVLCNETARTDCANMQNSSSSDVKFYQLVSKLIILSCNVLFEKL
jgi:hypothetical protein